MNAQNLIDTCDKYNFNLIQSRKEMNISWLLNDIIKQYKEQNETN